MSAPAHIAAGETGYDQVLTFTIPERNARGRVVRLGTTSVTIVLEVWVKPTLRDTEDRFTLFKVTEAAITYVSIGEDGKKQPIRPVTP